MGVQATLPVLWDYVSWGDPLAFVLLGILGLGVGIIVLMLWAHWPCIVGRIPWRH